MKKALPLLSQNIMEKGKFYFLPSNFEWVKHYSSTKYIKTDPSNEELKRSMSSIPKVASLIQGKFPAAAIT